MYLELEESNASEETAAKAEEIHKIKVIAQPISEGSGHTDDQYAMTNTKWKIFHSIKSKSIGIIFKSMGEWL